jgi:Ca2+/Na+ antiporter
MPKANSKFIFTLALMLGTTAVLKFVLASLLDDGHPVYLRLISALIILMVGAAFTLTRSADIIESTTEVLSKKTRLSAGLLQSIGTAFPDMILGITAALVSLSLAGSDPVRAISYAMIAASTTFGSNIYNIGFGIWCLWRQNRADKVNATLKMFPLMNHSGNITPLAEHREKPRMLEMDIAIRILTVLTLLTAGVALAMVAFGHITIGTAYRGDLYQLIRPAGFVIFIISLATLFHFRRDTKEIPEAEAAESSLEFEQSKMIYVWLSLIAAGITIAYSAESMVHALETVSTILHIPYVVTGTLAGIVGCLGEMIVIHNYTVNQNGRIGDAVVGIAMDNVVTIIGASIVSLMGGIFLGGTSLIILFVVILTLNTVLIEQISQLKNTIFVTSNPGRL